MSKRHADSTQDENPRKRRKLSAYEVLVEATRNGDTTAVRAVLEKLPPGSKAAFDAVHEACRGNHDECLALLLPYVETTQVGFGIFLSVCVHADHVACTEVLLQHWKSVCSNVAFVPLKSKHNVCKEVHHYPAMWSDPAVCRVFIDAGADVLTKCEAGCSPLWYFFTSGGGALEVVKMLVEAGADLVECNEEESCLTAAALFGQTETVRYLVGLPQVDVNHSNFCGRTALHSSIVGDVAQVLIDAGADIEAVDSSRCSPLHNACTAGALDVVRTLVEAGAEVRTTDDCGNMCLHLAALFGHTETVRYLVGLPQVDVNHRDSANSIALHLAMRDNHPDVAQVLIDAGADIEAERYGHSPLHTACYSRALDIVKMLVRAGAGVCLTDNTGNTCLHLAALCGHTETVRYLVGLPEVDMNHRDSANRTALHLAKQNKHTNVAQLLIAAGADIETQDNWGRSPLHTACNSRESLDIVKMLVEAGAEVRVTDNTGSTCLHLAAECGHTETVRYLVGLPEVDMNHRDSANRTALHFAKQKKHTNVAQLLIAAGADTDTENSAVHSP